jgi:DNA-binding SARP family transcriptional activator
VKFGILGPLEVQSGHEYLPLTAPKLRKVLALLLLHNNRMVQNKELIDELWGTTPPPSAQSTLQTYIYKLRQLLTETRGPTEDEKLLTKLRGYMIRIPPEDLDLWQFHRLAAEGRKALDNNDPEPARKQLAQALSLWRGPVLADVDTGEVLAAHATRLEEERIQSLEARLEADLQLGRHAELISELKALSLSNPLHEGYHAKLMVALHRSGRRGEALEVYQQFRRGLVDELGLEPGRELHLLQKALLSSDPTIDFHRRSALVTTRTGRAGFPSRLGSPLAPPAPGREPSEATTVGVRRSKDDVTRRIQGDCSVNQPLEQANTALLAAQGIDQKRAGESGSTVSAEGVTKMCDETVGLVKEAIVTVTSAVLKPLEWESDCTSALRQLTRVLGLLGTIKDNLSADGMAPEPLRRDAAGLEHIGGHQSISAVEG